MLVVTTSLILILHASTACAQFLRLPSEPTAAVPGATTGAVADTVTSVPPAPVTIVPEAPVPADPFAYSYDQLGPNPNWDPFGTPGAGQGTLLAEDPRLPGTFGQLDMTTMTRFLNQVWFEYSYIPGNAVKEFGMNNMELRGSFAIPFLNNPMTPLLITPGIAPHFLSGPKDGSAWPASTPADMPALVLDTYLDTAWNPRISPSGMVSAELAVRIGVYSDYKKLTTDAIRITGAGLLVLRISNEFWLKGGVQYLDLNRIKLLPVGGLIWVPGGVENARMRLELFFPTPKFAIRLPDDGETIWWLYLRGEYYTNNWQIKRVNPDPAVNGMADSVDYNDIRFAIGIEVNTPERTSFIFEVGISFNRELVYRSNQPSVYRPNPMILLRTVFLF